MRRTRVLFAGLSLLGLLVACGVGSSIVEDAAEEQRAALESGGGLAPMFEVDPLWPKNLPNHWLMGATIGVDVDSRDHIWVVHRNTPDQFVARTEIGLVQDPPLSECCAPGPPVLEFDQEGNLLSSWGGPGTETGDYTWPVSNHGITIDHMDNVWIGGNGGPDSHVLKFARDGSFLKQFGSFGARAAGEEDGRALFERDSHAADSFGRVAKIGIDPDANEAYLADGLPEPARCRHRHGDRRAQALLGRVRQRARRRRRPRPLHAGRGARAAVSRSGALLGRSRTTAWCTSATGPRTGFRCSRRTGPSSRKRSSRRTPCRRGSTWDIDFSHDAEQTYLYLADGQNMKVYILLRETLEVLTAFGDGGRQPGMFFAVHSIAVDSDGNIYTTETYEGSRVQKFIYKGMGPIPAGAEGTNSQGVLWPTSVN